SPYRRGDHPGRNGPGRRTEPGDRYRGPLSSAAGEPARAMTGYSDRRPPDSGVRSRWSGLLRGLFWLTLLVVFTLAVMPHPPHLPVEPSDKVQHFAAFACLMLIGSA